MQDIYEQNIQILSNMLFIFLTILKSNWIDQRAQSKGFNLKNPLLLQNIEMVSNTCFSIKASPHAGFRGKSSKANLKDATSPSSGKGLKHLMRISVHKNVSLITVFLVESNNLENVHRLEGLIINQQLIATERCCHFITCFLIVQKPEMQNVKYVLFPLINNVRCSSEAANVWFMLLMNKRCWQPSNLDCSSHWELMLFIRIL